MMVINDDIFIIAGTNPINPFDLFGDTPIDHLSS